MRLIILFFLPLSCLAQTELLRSEVRFEVGNLWLNTVKGTFSEAKGKVWFSPERLDSSFFDLYIDAKTVDTGNDKRDEHLLTEDFFHVEEHPEIAIRSEEIKRLDEGNFLLKGILTIKGISQPFDCAFSVEENREGLKVLQSQFTVERENFALGESYGGFVIADEIDVWVEMVLR
jgi:polyisoprenoid-binding protein YceI